MSRILEMMRTTTHNGFPVFADEEPEDEDGGGGGGELPSTKALVGLAHSSSAAGEQAERKREGRGCLLAVGGGWVGAVGGAGGLHAAGGAPGGAPGPGGGVVREACEAEPGKKGPVGGGQPCARRSP